MKFFDNLIKKYLTFYQFAKFVIVGIINTAVDFGILNILIFATQTSSGTSFSIFKGISFTAAVLNSYVWNRFWTFKDIQEKNPAAQFGKFILISIIGFGINVGIASLVVNVIGAQFGISSQLWANIGAICATAISWIWNFTGYKLWAFRKNN